MHAEKIEATEICRHQLQVINLRMQDIAAKMSNSYDGCSTYEVLFAVESTYLHIRMIVEAIMYISVRSITISGGNLNKKIIKAYDPKSIEKMIKDHKIAYYPEPVHFIKQGNGTKIQKAEGIDYLRKTDAIDYWNRAGDILHSKNTIDDYDKLHNLISKAQLFHDKTMRLLYSFTIENRESEHALFGAMRDPETNRAEVHIGLKLFRFK